MSAFDSGRRLTKGYCRERMAESAKKIKNCALGRSGFFPFSKLSQGAWVGLYAGFPDRQAISLFCFSTRYRRLCEVSESK
jgi:hypothetical protein